MKFESCKKVNADIKLISDFYVDNLPGYCREFLRITFTHQFDLGLVEKLKKVIQTSISNAS